jgi:hypothetical protein
VNNKVLVIAVALLAVAMLTTPLVSAIAGSPKTNDKFQTWHTEKKLNFFTMAIGGEHVWIPSFEKCNRLVITSTEGYITYEITVGTNTYTQGVDFAVVDTYSQWHFNKPVFANPDKLYTEDAKAGGIIVEVTFDFSAYPGGIEGTLKVRSVSSEGESGSNSLAGTGDLQNVQVKSQYSYGFVAPFLTVFEDGTVFGWPE